MTNPAISDRDAGLEIRPEGLMDAMVNNIARRCNDLEEKGRNAQFRRRAPVYVVQTQDARGHQEGAFADEIFYPR